MGEKIRRLIVLAAVASLIGPICRLLAVAAEVREVDESYAVAFKALAGIFPSMILAIGAHGSNPMVLFGAMIFSNLALYLFFGGLFIFANCQFPRRKILWLVILLAIPLAWTIWVAIGETRVLTDYIALSSVLIFYGFFALLGLKIIRPRNTQLDHLV